MQQNDAYTLPPREPVTELPPQSTDSEASSSTELTVTQAETQYQVTAPSTVQVGGSSYPILTTTKFDHTGAVKLDSLASVVEFAKLAHASGLFEGVKNPAQAVMKITFGLQMGLSPTESLNDLFIVKGQVGAQGRQIARKFKASSVYSYEIVDLTDEQCVIRVSENNKVLKPDVVATYKEYKDNKITDKLSWQVDRQGQLFNKCVARAQKRHAPDLFSVSVSLVDDLRDMEDLEAKGRIVNGNLIPPVVPDAKDKERTALAAMQVKAKEEKAEAKPQAKTEIVEEAEVVEEKKDTSPTVSDDMLGHMAKVASDNKWTIEELVGVVAKKWNIEPEEMSEKQWTKLVDHLIANAPGTPIK